MTFRHYSLRGREHCCPYSGLGGVVGDTQGRTDKGAKTQAGLCRAGEWHSTPVGKKWKRGEATPGKQTRDLNPSDIYHQHRQCSVQNAGYGAQKSSTILLRAGPAALGGRFCLCGTVWASLIACGAVSARYRGGGAVWAMLSWVWGCVGTAYRG